MALYKCYLICWIISLSSFVFVLEARAAALNLDYETAICIPNATFHIDCNRCKCSPSGMSMDCTEWRCATRQIHHDLLMNLTLSCKPHMIFLYRDELKCLCSANGRSALCSTARYELAHDLRGPISLGRRAAECPPGLVFKSQRGDTCICGNRRRRRQRPACLIRGGGGDARAANSAGADSPPAGANTSGDEKQKVCVPSASFSLDCNQCVCSDDGSSFSCDSFPCLGVEMRDDQLLNLTLACTPSSLFLYNSHECLCSADGANAICSLAAAAGKIITHISEATAAGEVVVTETRRSCTPGAVFKDACNVCICGEDREAACTMMDCAYGWEGKRNDNGRIVRREDLWVQRIRNKRFCRKNEGSMYCVYLRAY